MDSRLNMALDDISRKRGRNSGGRGRGGRNFNRGGGRANNDNNEFRGRRFVRARSAGVRQPRSQFNPTAPVTDNLSWSHDLYADDDEDEDDLELELTRATKTNTRNRQGGLHTGAKLRVSNLDEGVSDNDIHDLFISFGDLKKATVIYDNSSRSIGVAEVVFARREDAQAALKRYNGVPLDGKPMKIEFARDNSFVGNAGGRTTRATEGSAVRVSRGRTSRIVVSTGRGGTRRVIASSLRRAAGTLRRQSGQSSERLGGGGSNRIGRGRFRARGRGRATGRTGRRNDDSDETPSKEALDSELEKYMSVDK